MNEKKTKKDEYIEAVEKFAAYVNHSEKIVGVYATTEDCLIADSSYALKRLTSYFKYKIQMVIK